MIGPLEGGVSQHYQNALGEINRELRHPSLQRKIFSLSQASPKELVRARSITEIQQRALSYVPDDLLEDIPEDNNTYSLFQGFQATIPEAEEKEKKKKHGARNGRGQRLLEDGPTEDDARPITKLKNEKQRMTHRLEMMGVRKNMCSTEIREIDNKISNLNSMRKIVLDRLAGLEQEELMLEHEIGEAEMKLEDMQEQIDDEAALATHATPIMTAVPEAELLIAPDSPAMDASFMSESIYQKLPSPAAKTKRPKTPRRRTTTHILHEHLQAGSKIRELQAHNDTISALDFDVPFGTMVTAALDDTVRVWDLNAGRCVGLLEGHLSSVRCLQVEDNIVATGSMDASVRLWDLNQADYIAPPSARINKSSARSNDNDDDDYNGHEDELDADSASLFDDPTATRPTQAASMRDCGMFTLSAHVAEITALHFHNATLVSGSADKTLRQWDLGTGRCVQTLDVLWAAAQASSTMLPPNASSAGALLPDLTTTAGAFSAASPAWRPSGGSTGRAAAADASADFVGALQCFDAALACGTADGLVRLWDLRSGQVHRSLVGHTGPVTALQFDDVHLVTGSLDRSIRVSLYSAAPFARLALPFHKALTRTTADLPVPRRTDMGPAHRQHLRRLRLRPPRLEHDVRRAPHRRRRRRALRSRLRQDRRLALGLRGCGLGRGRGRGRGRSRRRKRGRDRRHSDGGHEDGGGGGRARTHQGRLHDRRTQGRCRRRVVVLRRRSS